MLKDVQVSNAKTRTAIHTFARTRIGEKAHRKRHQSARHDGSRAGDGEGNYRPSFLATSIALVITVLIGIDVRWL